MTTHTLLLLCMTVIGAASPLPMDVETAVVLANAANGSFSRSGAGGCDASGDKSYDFNLLVEQWPMSMGEQGSDFTLHGMWPSRSGSDAATYPCQCTDEQFDASQLSSIISDMNEYWPSYEGSNDEFWSHEWGKHGTCTGLSQLSFFSVVLRARAKFDAGTAFKSANIVPGNSYSITALNQAFVSSIGAQPLLGCSSGNSLKEVGWCLTKTATSVTDCSSSVQAVHGEFNNCDTSSNILIPNGSGPGPSPPSPSPPSPPGPPSPGGECVPDKHGPPCSSDSDCVNIHNCLRCAHSGYCTSEPKIFIN